MKKSIWVAILLMFVIQMTGCSNSSQPEIGTDATEDPTTTELSSLHQDAVINQILNQYNTLSDVKLEVKDIDQDTKYETIVTVDGGIVYISDSSVRKKIEINIIIEAQDEKDLILLASNFIKAADPDIEDREIIKAFKKLENNKYIEKPYKIDRWEMTLNTTDLIGKDEKQFIFKSSLNDMKE